MSRIKEFYHDQICEGQRQAMEDADLDRQYEEYIQEQAKHFGLEVNDPLTTDDIEKINDALKEEQRIEEMAEDAAFMRIFELTHTYPF